MGECPAETVGRTIRVIACQAGGRGFESSSVRRLHTRRNISSVPADGHDRQGRNPSRRSAAATNKPHAPLVTITATHRVRPRSGRAPEARGPPLSPLPSSAGRAQPRSPYASARRWPARPEGPGSPPHVSTARHHAPLAPHSHRLSRMRFYPPNCSTVFLDDRMQRAQNGTGTPED
jgi:hypothetical protein